MSRIDRFLNYLPQNLFDKSISLEELGIPRIAWHASDALEVIEICQETAFVILGGDVLVINPTVAERLMVRYTADNWYYNLKDSVPKSKQVIMSCDYAKTRVMFYSNLYGEEAVLFDLVIEDKVLELT